MVIKNCTNADIVGHAIYGRDAITTTGNMSTDAYRAGFSRMAPYLGHLPERLCRILDARFAAGAIVQVIYSYSTPIAWLDAGSWIVPEVTYSVTTSAKHQSHLCRLAAEYIPWDCGMDEYMQVLNGMTRYARHDGGSRRTYRGTGV